MILKCCTWRITQFRDIYWREMYFICTVRISKKLRSSTTYKTSIHMYGCPPVSTSTVPDKGQEEVAFSRCVTDIQTKSLWHDSSFYKRLHLWRLSTASSSVLPPKMLSFHFLEFCAGKWNCAYLQLVRVCSLRFLSWLTSLIFSLRYFQTLPGCYVQ